MWQWSEHFEVEVAQMAAGLLVVEPVKEHIRILEFLRTGIVGLADRGHFNPNSFMYFPHAVHGMSMWEPEALRFRSLL